jgi:phytoene dehydrogenase-like protein
MHDLAIVGAGPAGLSAAYHLRESGLDVVVLEAAGHVGGRTLSISVGGFPSNTGAMFVYRGTPSEELALELGIRTVAFTPTTFGIHINGVTVVDSDNNRLIERLPISEKSKTQLREFIATATTEYDAMTDGGRLTTEAGHIAEHTVADRFDGLEPEVVDIITHGVQGGGVAGPEQLSAKYALRYFASYLAHEADNRLYPLDGMQSIPIALAEHLPEGSIRLNSLVQSVQKADGGGYTLNIEGSDDVHAREVLLAVPAPIVGRLVSDLPAWKRVALDAAYTPGSTELCVTVDVTDLDDIPDWAFITTVGRPFDAIISAIPHDPRRAADGRLIAQFVCYGNSAGYRPDLVAADVGTSAWVDEFLAVAPQLNGRIIGAHLHTWEHCFAIITPRRLAAVPQLQESINGLHFAGDYTSESAGTHGAYGEGQRVAQAVRERLSTAAR